MPLLVSQNMVNLIVGLPSDVQVHFLMLRHGNIVLLIAGFLDVVKFASQTVMTTNFV
jgi:hypothetical protein